MSLQTLSRDCTIEDILAALAKDGACIIKDLLSQEELAALDADLNPLIHQTPTGVEEFGGLSTKRTGALVARYESVRPIVMHPLIRGAAEAFLSPYCERIQLADHADAWPRRAAATPRSSGLGRRWRLFTNADRASVQCHLGND